MSTSRHGEHLRIGLAALPRLAERPIPTADFRDQLADAVARRSRETFPSLVTFRHEVRSGQAALRFLEMATLPATSLSSPRIRIRHTFSRLAHDDQIEKWLHGGDYPRRYGGVAVNATAEVLLRLSDSDLVESVQEDARWQMSIHRVGQIVKCDLAHRNGITGKGVTVAVIDTGIDASHPAFAGRIDRRSRSFGDGLKVKDYTDHDGHGTHVAGIIGGDGSGSDSGRLRGIAPGVKLLVLKVSRSTGVEGDVAAAVDFAMRCGADVINISGNRRLPEPVVTSPWVWPIQESFIEMAMTSAVFCRSALAVAAGNDGWRENPESTITPPAINQHVLAVGSVTLDPQPRLSSFSSQGPVMRTDGVNVGNPTSLHLLGGAPIVRIPKPDVLAPGGEMDYSTASGGFGLPADEGVISTRAYPSDSEQYVTSAGTSMACPVIAGIAALIIEYARLNSLSLDEHQKRAFIVHNLIRAGARNLGLTFAEQGYGLADCNRIFDILAKIRAGLDSLDNYLIAPARPQLGPPRPIRS